MCSIFFYSILFSFFSLLFPPLYLVLLFFFLFPVISFQLLGFPHPLFSFFLLLTFIFDKQW